MRIVNVGTEALRLIKNLKQRCRGTVKRSPRPRFCGSNPAERLQEEKALDWIRTQDLQEQAADASSTTSHWVNSFFVAGVD